MDYFRPQNDSLLTLLSDPSVLLFVQQETVALEHIVHTLSQEIKERERLEQQLLDALEYRRQLHSSDLLNLQGGALDRRRTVLEERLELISQQSIDVKTQTFRDTLELKKLLWHYWFILQQKTAQRYFLTFP